MTYYTSGETGRFAAANAVEFGQCVDCGDGATSGVEADEVPLFTCGERVLCAGCCKWEEEEAAA